MKTQLKQTLVSSSILVMAFASAYITGCSKVNFTAAPQDCGVNCTFVTTNGNYDYTYDVKASKADILFVVDNSASMSPMQSQMGSKFANFLTQIQNLDYQIGVTTTDITSNTAPYNGQSPTPIGGQLVRFSDGTSVLNNKSVNVSSQFATAVTRQETLNCENVVKTCPSTGCNNSAAYQAACPSEDTRAIYAANLALGSNSSGLFRGADVPLNVVILSNADERAIGGNKVNGAPALTANDMPESLVANVQAQYPGKQLKVHSIIIKPGDTACYNNQDQRSKGIDLFGWYGVDYNQLSSSTSGLAQSICNNSFDLSAIGASVNADDGSRDLACNPKSGTLSVTLSPASGIGYSVITTVAGGSRLQFNSALPAGTSVRLSFSCQ